jgi:hypothetical protein
MRFSDDGVHLTDTDLGALISQHDAELARLGWMVIRVLQAKPDELERMRREYNARLLAARAEDNQTTSPPTASHDTTLTITRAHLAALIRDELDRNNAHWEQITNWILYSDQRTLERIRAAHEQKKAAKSTPPPA